MFITLQYGLEFHPAFDAAVDEVHVSEQLGGGNWYDTSITFSYCAL
jgi:hypothetical protein